MFKDSIEPDMPVICSEGDEFAEVDHMEGDDMIKLKRDDDGVHHYIPLDWVSTVADGKVQVDRSGSDVKAQWSEIPSF